MFRPRPVIEFLCRPEDEGLIAEPVPAKSALPAWFRQLPGVDKSQLSATKNGLTVKSCLFLPPINRPNGVIEVISGLVDTDSYRSPVNFPFVAVAPDGVHSLKKGTPLVQVIQ